MSSDIVNHAVDFYLETAFSAEAHQLSALNNSFRSNVCDCRLFRFLLSTLAEAFTSYRGWR